QRLPRIVGRHFHTAGLETLADRIQDVVVKNQLALKHSGYHLLGDVILCWPKASDSDEQGRAVQTSPNGVFQVLFIITNDGLHHDRDPVFIELAREEERIRVDKTGSQQLRADSDDFSRYHELQGRGLPMIPRRTL